MAALRKQSLGDESNSEDSRTSVGEPARTWAEDCGQRRGAILPAQSTPLTCPTKTSGTRLRHQTKSLSIQACMYNQQPARYKLCNRFMNP